MLGRLRERDPLFGLPRVITCLLFPGGRFLNFCQIGREKTLSWERVAGRSPDGCGAVCRTKSVPPLIPRRRSPSPPGKVAGPMALTDEGDSALQKNRARMNGKARRGGYQPPGRSGARAGGLYVSSHRSCPSGPGAMWASPPTRKVGLNHSTEPGLIRKGSPPHPALRGHLLQAGEGRGRVPLAIKR